MTTTNTNEIRSTILAFLEDWDRQEWQSEHGSWASEEWDDDRAAYQEAVGELRGAVQALPNEDAVETRWAYVDAVDALWDAVEALPDADRVDGGDDDAILVLRDAYQEAQALVDDPALERAYRTVREAAESLAGQVRPDEGDHIATGLIDPDGVADRADDLGVGDRCEVWDATEGWRAYRVGSALYCNWYRVARGNRHDRDLWAVVDDEFFE